MCVCGGGGIRGREVAVGTLFLVMQGDYTVRFRGATAKTEPCSFSVGIARLRSLPVHRP